MVSLRILPSSLTHTMCFVLGGHSYLLLLLFAFLLFLLLVSSIYVLSSSWNVLPASFSPPVCVPIPESSVSANSVVRPTFKLHFATVDPSLLSKPIGQQERVFGLRHRHHNMNAYCSVKKSHGEHGRCTFCGMYVTISTMAQITYGDHRVPDDLHW